MQVHTHPMLGLPIFKPLVFCLNYFLSPCRPCVKMNYFFLLYLFIFLFCLLGDPYLYSSLNKFKFTLKSFTLRDKIFSNKDDLNLRPIIKNEGVLIISPQFLLKYFFIYLCWTLATTYLNELVINLLTSIIKDIGRIPKKKSNFGRTIS